MKSKLLEKNGLVNQIGGLPFDFRFAKRGETIKDDIQSFLNQMEIQPILLYSGQQVHGKEVAYADGIHGDEFLGGKIFAQTDGLVTDKPGIALLIKFADCTPLVLFDPVSKVQAIVHSGWRSTRERISQIALNKMVDQFGVNKDDILVYIGPSIDQENYQVGPEVYQAFKDFKHRDEFFQKDQGDRYLLSMTDANISILKEAGIQEEQMEISRHSTYTSEKLHSARRQGKLYGLNAMITMLPEF